MTEKRDAGVRPAGAPTVATPPRPGAEADGAGRSGAGQIFGRAREAGGEVAQAARARARELTIVGGAAAAGGIAAGIVKSRRSRSITDRLVRRLPVRLAWRWPPWNRPRNATLWRRLERSMRDRRPGMSALRVG